VARTWRGWAEKRGFDAEHILGFAHGRKAAETIRMISPDLDQDQEVKNWSALNPRTSTAC
jgi:sugar-phosphatase